MLPPPPSLPGRTKVQHKGRGKKYLTEEEIRIAEEKKMREKEWKVSFMMLVEFWQIEWAPNVTLF